MTLAATYGGVYFRAHHDAPAEEHAEKLEIARIKPITVPIIAEGVVKGYVSAEFNVVAPKLDAHAEALNPESFIMDEAFRLIYSDTKIDFSKLDRADLSSLTKQLAENVNQRLGKAVVKEVLVKNFTFVSSDDLPR